MKVVACEHCDTRYRLDPAKFNKPRLRIRCKKCGEPFDVDLSEPDAPPVAQTAQPAPQPPASAPSPPPTTTSPQPPSEPAENSPPATAASPSPSAAPAPAAGTATVLIAHANPEVVEEIRKNVAPFAGEIHTTDNGVDALMYIETHKPQLAILDVALPKMFGFEVCEIVRRDEELSGVRVVLVAAIYDESRYKRPPSSLYGADDYIEKHRIPEELQEKVSRLLGASATEPPASSESAPPVAEPPAPEASPTTSAPASATAATEASAAAGIDPELLERARRLARTIISDIALYNTEKIDEAVAGGDPEQILADELAEGAQLFAERIAPEVRDAEPFLRNALMDYIANKRQAAGQ